MSTPSDTHAGTDHEPGDVPAQRRLALNEDWAATVVGLLLLVLILSGLWPGGWSRDRPARRPTDRATDHAADRAADPAADPAGDRARHRDTSADPPPVLWRLGGVAVVLVLGGLVRYLEQTVPDAAEGTALSGIADAIEYPVYAIALGLLGNVVLTLTGLRERLSGGFRTEFFIKTGLVLLGASIDFSVIVRAAGPAVVQAVVLITVVFGFTWWLAGRAGVDDKLRALLASAVSICGVSAAIAAAGAVQARKEQLAYTASLVILFRAAVDLPAARRRRGAGVVARRRRCVDRRQHRHHRRGQRGRGDRRRGGAADRDHREDHPERAAGRRRGGADGLLHAEGRAQRLGGPAGPREFWERFPKFVLGFLAASMIATVFVATAGSDVAKPLISDVNAFRTTFLILAFVSIGLEFRMAPLREAGWRPIGVFAAATGVNLAVGLGLAVLLFSGLTV